MNAYLTFKALHLIAVISWMAGLLYLPRIFVYHAETIRNLEQSETFKLMEKKTIFLHYEPSYDFIMGFRNFINSFSRLRNLTFLWMKIKLGLVLVLTAYHFYLLIILKDFQLNENTKSSKFFRIINEVPYYIVNIHRFCGCI